MQEMELTKAQWQIVTGDSRQSWNGVSPPPPPLCDGTSAARLLVFKMGIVLVLRAAVTIKQDTQRSTDSGLIVGPVLPPPSLTKALKIRANILRLCAKSPTYMILLILITTPRVRCCSYSHYIDEKVEALRGQAAHLRFEQFLNKAGI